MSRSAARAPAGGVTGLMLTRSLGKTWGRHLHLLRRLACQRFPSLLPREGSYRGQSPGEGEEGSERELQPGLPSARGGGRLPPPPSTSLS